MRNNRRWSNGDNELLNRVWFVLRALILFAVELSRSFYFDWVNVIGKCELQLKLEWLFGSQMLNLLNNANFGATILILKAKDVGGFEETKPIKHFMLLKMFSKRLRFPPELLDFKMILWKSAGRSATNFRCTLLCVAFGRCLSTPNHPPLIYSRSCTLCMQLNGIEIADSSESDIT